jgi:septal ring factor EnvC (AmiA/AmiB activator)
MTDDLTEMRGRQDRLEGRVTVLEATVKEEASLRAKMDSDLGEMKATLIAHKHSLQALHDTQTDHTKRLTRIENRVENIEVRVEAESATRRHQRRQLSRSMASSVA